MSDSLQPHESQHARPPCPSPTPGVHSDSRPSSQWCHPAISSSVIPFSCPQSLPASDFFPMSQLFTWGGQSTGVSALASFLPKKSQGWSPSEWTGWISLQSKGLSPPFSEFLLQMRFTRTQNFTVSQFIFSWVHTKGVQRLGFVIWLKSFWTSQRCKFWCRSVEQPFLPAASPSCSSVAQLCLIPCDPMDCSMPSFLVLHCLLEFAQTHIHWVSDAIQPSHPMLPPSAFYLTQHQSLFQWVGSSHQVAKVLELQLQHQSFQWMSRVDVL